MKRYKCVSILFILLLLILCGCGNTKKSEESEIKQKANTEILYLENELVIMANNLNNINYLNYSVTTEQIQGSKKSSKQSEDGDKNKTSESDESNQDSKSQSTEQTKSENNDEVYEITSNNLLERNKTINWKEEKSKIEKLYSTLPVICTDLKEIGISIEDIDKLTNSIDNLTNSILNEQTQETMNNITAIYGLFPEFIKKYDGESKNQKIINLKHLALLCYRDVSNNEWENLEEDLNNLKLNFSNIKLNNEFSDKEINIKKGESIIEEMKNCINNKNQEIFFIKYKNFMQELNLITME